MTAAKITISLPEPTLAKARSAVRGGDATSVSAYIAQAVDEKRDRDDLRRLLEELLAESGGPLTARETARARSALGLPVRRAKKRA